jgi:NAD-dependent dihydropyrimidine dehydrogenase PreA subunit
MTTRSVCPERLTRVRTADARMLHTTVGSILKGSTMSTVASGGYEVVVNPGRCENKRECLGICPTDVFEMVEPRVGNLFIRLKIRVHGGVIAAPVREDACIGCMACVSACPEDAMTVTSRGEAPPAS